MKNILSLTLKTIVLFFGMSCGSCDKVVESSVKRVFVNLSSFKIRMLVYTNDTLDFQISQGDSAVFEGKSYGGPGLGYLDAGWYDPAYSLTARVIFNNEKELIYNSSDDCDTLNRNPISSLYENGLLCGYEEFLDVDGWITYTYSFTDIDYQNAVPIGG